MVLLPHAHTHSSVAAPKLVYFGTGIIGHRRPLSPIPISGGMRVSELGFCPSRLSTYGNDTFSSSSAGGHQNIPFRSFTISARSQRVYWVQWTLVPASPLLTSNQFLLGRFNEAAVLVFTNSFRWHVFLFSFKFFLDLILAPSFRGTVIAASYLSSLYS